ncbi:cupin domain-containing protein [Kocuria sp.]|jgi:mannose-6-phosphate isomerase-like protein (cupin superfamily)|uniref:cupin domain-containing protein n=1 Tax=Kocuria sp. TaxID=1871328 RepID=UPI002810B574|nr:cupin domain-containing protein [Kocuria sp.]HST71088.1 cupin domain-containing protein [Kocuria rosea]
MTGTSDSAPGGYVLTAEEGTPFWFLGSLVTVKVDGARTRGKLTIVDFVNPPGFAPPVHRHLEEDEVFYIVSGRARFVCDGTVFDAGPGDFVFLPVGSAHTFLVAPQEPLHTLQITVPAGFEEFTAEAGTPALERVLPGPGPVDPAALAAAAARHHIEILGPPPASL